MAVVEVDLIGSLEPGTFDQNGNDYDRAGRLRSTRFTAYNRTMKLIAESNTGKALQFVMCGWDSNGNLSDYIGTWSDSGGYVSLSPSTIEIKIALRYSNDSSIAVEEIVSCVVDFSAGWIIKDGEITNDTFIDMPEKYMTKPYPALLWRIDSSHNQSFPYHSLLPGIRGVDIWALKRENVIRVFDISEPQNGFDHNGLAILEPSSCVSEHDDDRWDVELVHPIDDWGKWKNLLVNNTLLISGQIFRIDRQELTSNGQQRTMTVHAKHITCDLADELITFAEFEGGDGNAFIDFAFSNVIEGASEGPYAPYKFEGYSDIDTIQPPDSFVNTTLWGAFVGVDNCMKNKYGGELYRDNFYFSINKQMQYSKTNAFNIRYSLDMEGITQVVDYSDYCTDLWCFDNFGALWAVSYTPTMAWAVHHPVHRMVQFNYQEHNMDRLIADGMAYWLTVNVPSVTYKVPLAALPPDPRYDGFRDLQNYNYGDSGTIYCPELDINTTQKITYIKKDELTGSILSMTLGNVEKSFVRPAFFGSTISTGRDIEDKRVAAVENELLEFAFPIIVATPVASADGKLLTDSTGKFLLYKKG